MKMTRTLSKRKTMMTTQHNIFYKLLRNGNKMHKTYFFFLFESKNTWEKTRM